MLPTEEQVRAVDLFRTGGTLKINAFAGTGKTTTLSLMSASTSRQGLYLAFNKAIAVEATKSFPPGRVTCSTVHSLAFRSTHSDFRWGEKMTGRVNALSLAQQLHLSDLVLDRHHKLSARSQGFLILETLRRFMHSSDAGLHQDHVPRYGKLATASEAIIDAVGEATMAVQDLYGLE